MAEAGAEAGLRFEELMRQSEGPMKRLYLARYVFSSASLRPKLLSDKLLEKVVSKLAGKFPDIDVEKAQDKGLEALLSKAKVYMEEFEPHYLAMLEALDWKTRALNYLVEICSKVGALKMEDNPMMMCAWFDLFVRYVQCNVLLSYVPERRTIAVLYARLYQHTKCLAEPNFAKLAKWIMDNDDPFNHMQEDFKACTTILTNAIVELRTCVAATSNIADLRKGEALNVTLKPIQIAAPVHDEQLRRDMLLSGRVRTWLAYALLATPTAALQPRVVEDIAVPLLREFVVCPVWAELSVQPHRALSSVWGNYKDKKAKLDRFKKAPKEALTQACDGSAAMHRSRRIYARQELEQLLNVTRDTPALLGPKLYVVLAALSYAREEVLLYYRHRTTSVDGDSILEKYFHAADWSDVRVPDLIGVVHAVADHVRASAAVVSRYYAEFLAGADTAAARDAAAKIAEASGATQDAQFVADTLGSTDAEGLLSGSVDLEAVRRCCKQIEYSHSNAATARPALAEETRVFRVIYMHTRFVDQLNQVLDEVAGLTNLWYVHDALREDFEQYARTGAESNGPRYVAAYLRLLCEFPSVATPYWAEERELVGNECVRLAADYLDKTTAVVRQNMSACIANAVSNELQLRDRNGAELLASKRPDFKPPKDYVPPVVPASESAYEARAQIEPIRLAERNCALILKSLADLGVFVVYDAQMAPAEWFREMIQLYLQEWLRNAFKVVDGMMERPSEVLRQYTAVLSVLTSYEHYMTMHVEQVLRDTALNEFWVREVGKFGTLDAFPMTDIDYAGRTIGSIVNFYSGLCTKVLCSPQFGVVYSPNRRSFVARPGGAMRVEYWCDICEMRALAHIIGPNGVKLLDGWLLRFAHGTVAALKDVLITNAKVLEDVAACYTREQQLAEALKKLRDLDTFVQRCVHLGIALEMRAMLKEGLREACDRDVPHVESAISDAFDQYPRNTFADTQFLAMDLLAGDYGLPVGSADQELKTVLRTVHQEGDQKIWKLLPVMFALGFLSGTWREAAYLPSLGAYQNNVHVTSRVISDLIIGFCSLTLPPPQEERSVTLFLQQYIEISSAILLRMARAMPKSEKQRPVDFPGMLVFLDRFVEDCPLITRDILEANVPYSLLRNMFKDIYSPAHRVPEGW